MRGIGTSLSELTRLDAFAGGGTSMHRLDPRAKVLTTAVFLVCVVSFDKHDVSGLLPFALYPIAIASTGRVPFGYVIRKVLMVAPLALIVGLSNLFLDRGAAFTIGPIVLSGGVLSFTSIFVRFALTVATAVALIGVTGFEGLCVGLRRLGTPQVLTVQLLLLYRYIFVLVEEATRLARARSVRSFGKRGLGMEAYASMIGHFLLRAIDRAHRVHAAMSSRGFTGEMHFMRAMSMRGSDVAFVIGWCGAFVAMRFWNVPLLVGRLVTRMPG